MRTPTWVLGYHGCDREVGEAVLAGTCPLKPSENRWDWLGTGIYFWENSARRAFDWAEFSQANPQYFAVPVRSPFVLGAIIDLGNCLDLLEARSIRIVQQTHQELEEVFKASGSPMPRNKGQPPDYVVRQLDCAVMNYVHVTRERDRQPEFDSVRAAFMEGEPIYSGAGFHTRTHIQICVRHEAQIIGYFRVREVEVAAQLSRANSPWTRHRGTHRSDRRKRG